ncbi:MAG: type IV secretory system conjugative DNA transfer family protein, partial [Acidobacteriota bacterium]|nr:type IV secretory system conjugative DNA transfer family protein [Acidobacteriota bacterium]
GMTLAHQHLDQLTAEAKHAVLANARSRVIFQLSAGDAHVMARELGGLLTADDLQGLGAYEVVTQLYAQGATQAPATGRTRPLGPAASSSVEIRSSSRVRYGVAKDDVEAAIRDRQNGPTDAPVGRRQRDGGVS